MAPRSELQKRRTSLQNHIRAAVSSGDLQPGQMVPTVRQLAEQFQLSLSVANQALQGLVEEGLLYSVPRSGTFVGPRHDPTSEFYLLLLPDSAYLQSPFEESKLARLRTGFETHITRLGGAGLVLGLDQALQFQQRSEMPALAGVFNYAYDPTRAANWHTDAPIPQVGFASWAEDPEQMDLVSFDDIDAGRQAARFLIGLGHRQIAFLALHAENEPPGGYLWSADREAGWRQALEEIGLRTEALAFRPEHIKHLPSIEGQMADVEEAAARIVRRPDITAVIAANDIVALSLFQVLRQTNVPAARWPVVVGFDNLPQASDCLLTSFDLPWSEIGRAAADLLWQRRHGKLTGAPQHSRVSMRLIRRITTQSGWSAITPGIAYQNLPFPRK